ncbi:MAG: alpha/beta hydrolase-fold protein, partial [Gaiellaceae bacterium]
MRKNVAAAPAVERTGRLPRRMLALALAVMVVGAMSAGGAGRANDAGKVDREPRPRFIVTLAPGVAQQAHETAERLSAKTLDGRVFVVVTRNGDIEPRLQGPGLTENTPPFWGTDVDGLSAGRSVTLRGDDERVYGFPLPDLNDLPEGEYFVQAFMNVYETFHRSDGSTVKLHMPCGDGHRVIWGTGNVFSDVEKVQITHSSKPVRLKLSHVIPPRDPTPPGGTCQQANMAESQHVKFVKIKSELLSRFWGRPMYIAASVLLPKGYEEHSQARYPVVYAMSHHHRAYSLAGSQNPNQSLVFGNFNEAGTNPFSQWWLAENTPRVIVVRPLSENPFYDTSYWVDSPNVGPYGRALTEELLPEIDERFRAIGAAWARTQTGGSSGGWMSLAPQVFYPDLFGGAFILFPDNVDFRSFWLTNLYADENAYWNVGEWRKWPRPYIRDHLTGNTVATTEEWAHLELAMGNRSRSGEYFHQLQATWGPQGPDGYPGPAWDSRTGEIVEAAAEQYRKYD